MKTSSHPRLLLGSALLLGAIGAVLAARQAQAGLLVKYTGYTRPGSPPAASPLKGREAAAAATNGLNHKAIGGTIYFAVLDRSKGTPGDTWGSGIKGIDKWFVAGADSDDTRIDTKAKYLYLYQVVHDSGRPTPVRQVTIRLLVDPRHITSWGHWHAPKVDANGKPIPNVARGVGFAMLPDTKGVIRAISSEAPDVSDPRYSSPAPARSVPRNLTFREIGLYGPDVGKEAAGGSVAEVGRAPDRVVLLPSVLFEGAPLPSSRLPDRVEQEERRTRWPAVRAYWVDNPLKAGERSSVFGFPSNSPPVYDDARTRGRGAPAIRPASR